MDKKLTITITDKPRILLLSTIAPLLFVLFDYLTTLQGLSMGLAEGGLTASAIAGYVGVYNAVYLLTAAKLLIIPAYSLLVWKLSFKTDKPLLFMLLLFNMALTCAFAFAVFCNLLIIIGA